MNTDNIALATVLYNSAALDTNRKSVKAASLQAIPSRLR